MEENMEEGQTQKGTVLERVYLSLSKYFAVSLFALDTCQEG